MKIEHSRSDESGAIKLNVCAPIERESIAYAIVIAGDVHRTAKEAVVAGHIHSARQVRHAAAHLKITRPGDGAYRVKILCAVPEPESRPGINEKPARVMPIVIEAQGAGLHFDC